MLYSTIGIQIYSWTFKLEGLGFLSSTRSNKFLDGSGTNGWREC